MGHDNTIRTLERATENSVAFINEQLGKIDWNKKWQADYPKTERAKQELQSIQKPEVKDALSEVFDERSLVLLRTTEVTQ